jgi:tetratricopeptide (TPR) repeat protein
MGTDETKENVAFYIDRGMAYREKGEKDKALADFQSALRIAPDNAIARRCENELSLEKIRSMM